MKRLHIDIETYSPEPIAKTGLYRYAFHPDFRILLVAYAVDDDPVQIIDLAQIAEESTSHPGTGHLSPLVLDKAPQRLGEEGNVQQRMPVHAPERKADRCVRIIDRPVKIICIHCTLSTK